MDHTAGLPGRWETNVCLMMNPAWSPSWGPGLLLTNVLLTSRKQPVAEIRSVPVRKNVRDEMFQAAVAV